ncbi:MAG: radical SAM protein, partial [Alloprevotella sp.]|nr:radical SAM protein [Alloprevotella sp.]
MKVDIITMGCSKNLVDSQRLGKLFRQRGIDVCLDPQTTRGDVAVVNTCGFIGDAKEESVNMILDLCNQKESGQLKAVYVMGCLSQRYMEELLVEIPQVDKYYGKFDWEGLADELAPTEVPQKVADYTPSAQLTPPYYIKIAEGCDRKCAYCAIPIITGRHKSRPMEDIIAEMQELAAGGAREFQIIEQELTYYGVDIYGRQMIAPLVERMVQIPGVEWIRLH